MKFVASEDIAAPRQQVWEHVADLEGFEARARQRVKNIRRSPGPAAQGSRWSGSAEVVGKTRDVTVTAVTVEAPDELFVEAATDGMVITIEVHLEELGPALTRMTVTTDAKARSLTARLMLQSAKLARATMVKRYKGRVADFAGRIEAGGTGTTRA